MAKFNQLYIQDFWLGDLDARSVINSYGVAEKTNPKNFEKALGVLIKSKRDYIKGSPVVFKENVDRSIHSILHIK